MHSRQNKLQDKVEKKGEGNHNPCEKRQLDGEHEALCRLQRLHEDEFAACVYAWAGAPVYQGEHLVAQGLVESAVRFDKGFLFLFVLEGEGRSKEIDDPDVVADFVGILKRLKIVRPVFFLELVENLRNGLGGLPFVQVDTGILQGALFALLPYLGHRAANDIHQLIPENEARNGGDQEGEDDSRDRYPEILEVLEERLLGRGITLIPELKDFFQEKHPRWAIGLVREFPEVEGLVTPNFVLAAEECGG